MIRDNNDSHTTIKHVGIYLKSHYATRKRFLIQSIFACFFIEVGTNSYIPGESEKSPMFERLLLHKYHSNNNLQYLIK